MIPEQQKSFGRICLIPSCFDNIYAQRNWADFVLLKDYYEVDVAIAMVVTACSFKIFTKPTTEKVLYCMSKRTIEFFSEFFQSNCSLFLKLAKDIDKSRLTKDDSVTLSVLIDQLETFVNGYQWRM